MANELAVRASDMPVDDIYRVGKMLALSGYFDAKGSSDMAIAQVCTKILAGREMGYGPFASVQGIHIIQGKPSVSANLMAAAVKGSGRYDYRVRSMGDDAVSIEFFEVANGKRESLGVSSYTLKEAGAAGLTSNPTWKKFPRNMLFARALSNGVRWFCPDVFNGSAVYVPEELGANVDGDGNVIDVDYRQVDKATGEVLSTTPPAAPEPKANGKRQPTEAELLMRSVDAVEGKHHGYNGDMVGSDNPAPAPAPKANGKPDAAMFKRYNDAKEAARKSGKFNAPKHLENAWSKMFKEMNASDTANGDAFLAAWAEYVQNHETADDDVTAEVTQNAPEMAF